MFHKKRDELKRNPKLLRNGFNCLPNSQLCKRFLGMEGTTEIVLTAMKIFFVVDRLPREFRTASQKNSDMYYLGKLYLWFNFESF